MGGKPLIDENITNKFILYNIHLWYEVNAGLPNILVPLSKTKMLRLFDAYMRHGTT